MKHNQIYWTTATKGFQKEHPVSPTVEQLRSEAKGLAEAFWSQHDHKKSKALADAYYAVRCKLDVLERMNK
jgi:hypothetical protein